MIESRSNKWVGLLCDAAGATVLAAQETPAGPRCLDAQRVAWELDKLEQTERLPDLDRLVQNQRLFRCAAYLAFVGAGTLVQKLRLPPLSARNRGRAVRTRLTQYAGGRPLVVALQPAAVDRTDKTADWLAAGVESRLARGAHRLCRASGLRVAGASALAVVPPAPDAAAPVVQLILTERTTAVQMFEHGRLTACRDVLLGRRDFAAAYQRPILTERGPLALSPEQAETFLRELGIPIGRDEQTSAGFGTTQLWPLLNPVLQKLRHEIEETLTHGGAPPDAGWTLNVLTLPAIPGLGEYLAAELQLQGPLLAAAQAEKHYLQALRQTAGPGRPDLRPPEEKFIARLWRPALAACGCAAFVLLANSAAPREANAQLTQLRPTVAALQTQLEQARQQRSEAQKTYDALTAEVRRRARLQNKLPPQPSLIALLKAACGSVPPTAELEELRVQAEQPPAALLLRARYRGEVPASLVADRWARELAGGAFFTDAKVSAVGGSGCEEPARIEIQAFLR